MMLVEALIVKQGHSRTAPSLEVVVNFIELRIAIAVALDLPDIHHVMQVGRWRVMQYMSTASLSEHM